MSFGSDGFDYYSVSNVKRVERIVPLGHCCNVEAITAGGFQAIIVTSSDTFLDGFVMRPDRPDLQTGRQWIVWSVDGRCSLNPDYTIVEVLEPC